MIINTVKPFNRSVAAEGTSLTGGKEMGLVYADIELINGEDLVLHRHGFCNESSIRRSVVRALVDSGAYDLVIPETVRRQLDLPVLEQRTVRLADECIRTVDVVSPVEVRFEKSRTVVEAFVLPGAIEVLLGAIPLEGLDVVIDPKQQKLMVNPSSPDIASSIIKNVSANIEHVYSC